MIGIRNNQRVLSALIESAPDCALAQVIVTYVAGGAMDAMHTIFDLRAGVMLAVDVHAVSRVRVRRGSITFLITPATQDKSTGIRRTIVEGDYIDLEPIAWLARRGTL